VSEKKVESTYKKRKKMLNELPTIKTPRQSNLVKRIREPKKFQIIYSILKQFKQFK
jgi:hypothetical protein